MYIAVVGWGYPTSESPLGIFEFDQAKALAAAGHKVVYIGHDMRSILNKRKYGIRSFKADGVQVCLCSVPIGPLGPVLRVGGRLAFLSVFKHVIKHFGMPDVLHAHFAEIAMHASIAAEKYHIPFVITEHSSFINQDELKPSQVAMLKNAYSHADKLLAVSERLQFSIKKHTGFDAVLMPDMVDMDVFTIADRKNRADKPFNLLSAGLLLHRKGFDVLLDAFASFVKHHPESTLTIMGYGPMQGELEAQAERLGITNSVEFTGKYTREQFAARLSNADCFVLATRRETFGVVYIEAMAAGVPVIATICGGPESFVHKDCGLLVPIDDSTALFDAMQQISSNIASFDEHTIAEYVRKHFSPCVICDKLTNIYNSLIN